MNKLAKLPIFLGIVGGVCAGILAGVNAFTSPIISKAASDKKAAAYVSVYKTAGYNVELSDIESVDAVNLSDDLYNNGCTGKAIVAKAKGVVYDFSAVGYGGTFTFQVAFAEGKYIGYADISNGETPGFGADLIKELVAGSKKGTTAESSASEISTIISGRSKTGNPIVKAVGYASADYAVWYASNK